MDEEEKTTGLFLMGMDSEAAPGGAELAPPPPHHIFIDLLPITSLKRFKSLSRKNEVK